MTEADLAAADWPAGEPDMLVPSVEQAFERGRRRRRRTGAAVASRTGMG